MANEVEIVVTGRNKAKPAVQDAMKDAADIGKTYKETSRQSVSALNHIRDALRNGLHDAIADVNGETNRISRAFRTAQESVTAGFDRMRNDVRARLRDMVSEKDGRSAGARFAAGAKSALMNGLKATSLKGIGGGISKAFQGALSTPILGPIIVAALGAAAVGGGMTLASLLSGAIISGLGVGLVSAGAAALFHVEEVNSEWSKAEQKRVKESNRQAERLRSQWRETARDIVGGLKDAAQPLVPVLGTVRSTLRDVGREFRPVLKQGFEIAKGPLSRFVKSLGAAFKELKPAVVPVMAAFGALLDQTGPALPGVFKSIADSVIELAGIVNENRDLISSIFLGLLATLPLVIGLLGNMTSAFRGALLFAMGLLDGVLGAMQAVMGAIAEIPGPWQESAAAMAASLAGTRAELAGLKADVENFPEQVRLEGEISDLEGKIATAKARLKDPNLARPEKTKLRAEISDLQAKVAAAKSSLASIQDRSVRVFINQIYRSSGIGVGTVLAPQHAHGGVIGGLGGVRRFAQGGVSGAGSSLAMVGEQGPELVRLPVGSTVTGAGQTRAMQQGGFGSISMAFRQAQQAGGGSGGLAAMERIVVSFREAMEKLTGSIFNQERALSGYEAAWDAARRSLKENKKTLSIGTEKGRENRAALLSLAEAAQEVVIAMREQGRAASTVTAKMREQRSEFIKMARSMGLSKTSASKLADRYGLTTSAVKGALVASSGKASGGVAGGITLVGERGPELVRLPFGSQVTSANQTAATLTAGGGGSDRPIHIVLQIGTTALGEIIVDPLRKAVRTRGGNVQAVLGRS
ncbi:ABC transporter C-terminal domain-containing protein [Nonomuraea sp. NPDC048882]|uniref:ABC transporter C-terminal domain-containing protein n=1 Tax=Nonomuraea sp. NPDC048882 TaxID=3154347 RepID=UPI0033C56EE1